MIENAIKIVNLEKFYENGIHALKKINLSIKKGEIFALLGPNGAGKSTLINIICGIANKTSGHVSIFGYDNIKAYKMARSLIGLVPQEIATDSFERVVNTLHFSRGLFNKPRSEKIIKMVLKDLALEKKKNSQIRTLSGGMRWRLLIAKAMVHDPEILILDEPTAGVDVELRANLWTNINKLNNEGKTIIITTHYLHEAEELCNEIAIIDNGNLITKDTTSNIKSLIDRKQIIISLDSKNFNLDPIIGLDVECEINSDNLIINYKPSEISFNKILDALQLSNIQVKDLTINETNLEDVFLKLTKN